MVDVVHAGQLLGRAELETASAELSEQISLELEGAADEVHSTDAGQS
jgi:hypothetical protein